MKTKRLLRLVVAAAGLGVAAALLFVSASMGWRSTTAWVLGGRWPGETSLQISSGWWLLFGCFLWVGSQFAVSALAPEPRLRLACRMAGPVAVTWCLFSWATSVILYEWGVWDIRFPPYGVRWLLDGPPMTAWYWTSNELLWLIRVPGPEPPTHFGGGYTVAHIDGTVIALGALNGAMLAGVTASFAMLAVAGFRRIPILRHRTA